MADSPDEIIKLTHQLLTAIFRGDWATYTALCAEDITAFEPEAKGHLVQGLAFHQNYFPDKPSPPKRPGEEPTITISSPNVRIIGDAAVIAYVRLVQSKDEAGSHRTSVSEETRIWEKVSGTWKHVHFHRSPVA